jgi:HPr kinase/phosphorylase
MNLHATCVAAEGRGLLILGPSGSGKSALALQLMALGARLVADDRVDLERRGDEVVARCPPELSGLIEARGLGLLRADPLDEARLVLVADLASPPAERLPKPRAIVLAGATLPLVAAAANAHFPAALWHYLRYGRAE